MLPLDYTITLPTISTPFTIIPFGCLHADDPGFRKHLWDECVEDLQKPNTYGIGLGDYRNLLRTHARTHLRSYTADRNSWDDIDTMVRAETREFYKKMGFEKFKERLIGLAPGNHMWEFQNQTNDTQMLCELCNVPYLKRPTMIRLRIACNKRVQRTLILLVHHGDWSGGFTRAGGDLNSMENKSLGFEADMYLFSHTHRLIGYQAPMLTIPNTGKLEVVERPKLYCRTGCFLAGYDKKCINSYAQDKLLTPTKLGYMKIEVSLYRDYDRGRTEEWKARHADKLQPGGYHRGMQTNYRHKFSVTY